MVIDKKSSLETIKIDSGFNSQLGRSKERVIEGTSVIAGVDPDTTIDQSNRVEKSLTDDLRSVGT